MLTLPSFGSARPRRIPRAYRDVEEAFLGGGTVRLLRDGREALPAMLEAIEGAQRQVLLEMYWFGSDRTGRRFAEALKSARARGVEVAVLYDSLGSLGTSDSLFAELRASGVQVLEYNPIAPWRRRFRLAFLTRRDHRKLLVVDGRVGFTGGINLADQWLPEEDDGEGWRDDAIRIEGPAVASLVEGFAVIWRSQQGADLGRRGKSLPPAQGHQQVRVLADAFALQQREIVRAYLAQIWRAKHRVWLANSYFVPDPRVLRALRAAAGRGVDVRIIIPGRSDVEVVRHASRAVWGRLLRNGVRIYLWHKNVLHAKTAVIDGVWTTIGTFNLDYRSLRSNLEINVSVNDAHFARTMEQSYERDFALCEVMTLHDFRYRSLGERLLELLCYRFRKLL